MANGLETTEAGSRHFVIMHLKWLKRSLNNIIDASNKYLGNVVTVEGAEIILIHIFILD